jgi:hypothetical protein
MIVYPSNSKNLFVTSFPTTGNGVGGIAQKWTINGTANADHGTYTATYERKSTLIGAYFTDGQWVPKIHNGIEHGNLTY